MRTIAGFLIVLTGAVFAGGSLTGVVLSPDGLVIVNANVELLNTNRGASSHADGTFAMYDLLPGEYTLVASHIQYAPVKKTLQIQDNRNVSIQIQFRRKRVLEFNEITITATRNALESDKVPQSVSHLSAKEMDRQFYYNAGHALDQVPGVRVIRDGGTIGADYGLSIRSLNGGGYSNKTLVLVDGRPMNNGWNGGVNFNTIPMEIVERIEVVKGAGSALYGSQATAGVVNVITKTAEPGWHTWFSASKEADASDSITDSNADGYSRPAVEASTAQWTGSYRNRKSSHLFTLGLRSSSQQFQVPEQNLWDNTDFKYKFKYHINNQLLANVHLDFHKNTWEKPADRSPVENDYDYAGADVNLQYFGRRGVLNTRLFINRSANDEQSLVSTVSTGYTAYRSGFMGDYTYYLFNNRAQLQFGFDGILDRANVDYDLVVNNLSFQDVREINVYDSQSGKYFSRAVDLYTGQYGSTQQDYQLYNTAIFIQYQQDFKDRLHLVLGARLDKHSEFGTIVNPNAGLACRIFQFDQSTTHLKLNYARGFRAPTMVDLYSRSLSGYGDPDIQPEKTGNVDVGLLQRFADWGFVSISAFQMQVENLMISDKQGSTGWGQYVMMPNDSGTDTLFFDRRTNRGDYEPRGVEVTFKFRPFYGLSINGAYTFLDPRDFTFQTSKHRYNAGIYYEKSFDLTAIDFAWKYDYTGDGYFFDYQTNPFPAFALQNISIGVRLLDHYKISLHVKNVTDVEYRLWHHTWQPGRTVIVQFETHI